MTMYDIILKKKNGFSLAKEEIDFFINGYTKGEIPDYQASALLMAICLRGMNSEETVNLTIAMANSGDIVDLSAFADLSADKHSTGGVGDKTSVIVGPIVAALGGKVTKMSGRGLGHTGGTIDKLESVKGYKTNLTPKEFLSQVDKVGMAIIGQSGNLTPADKKLYALRDVTATVDDISLITSSIMSKKLAAGAKNIVLDVKFGSGAFMKNQKDAEILGAEMVKIGKSCNRKTAALITDMDKPLGYAVGNSLEIIEAVKILKNEVKNDLREVSVHLAKTMIMLIFGISEEAALEKVLNCLESGAAYAKMREWIIAQGGDIAQIDDTNLFEKAKFKFDIKSEKDGYISQMNTEIIGKTATVLGAGRMVKEDTVDHSAGIIINKKTGDRVEKNEIIATIYTNNGSVIKEAEKMYLSVLSFNNKAAPKKPLIYKTLF